MLGLVVLVVVVLLCTFAALLINALTQREQRQSEMRSRLMTYDEQLHVLRLLRRTRATLEDVLDPLLEPSPDEVRDLVAEVDKALELYYKS